LKFCWDGINCFSPSHLFALPKVPNLIPKFEELNGDCLITLWFESNPLCFMLCSIVLACIPFSPLNPDFLLLLKSRLFLLHNYCRAPFESKNCKLLLLFYTGKADCLPNPLDWFTYWLAPLLSLERCCINCILWPNLASSFSLSN